MMSQNTNKSLKIFILLGYILVSQVFGFVHAHTADHHGQLEVRISVHPPDFPMSENGANDHEAPVDDHDHEEFHQKIMDAFALRATSVTISLIHAGLTQRLIALRPTKPAYLSVPRFQEFILETYFYTHIPARAPPQFS